MLKNSKILILIWACLLVGIFLALVIKKFSFLSIKGEIGLSINPLEIFSMLVNILLAIYITSTLSRNLDTRKAEKDLLINYYLEYKQDFSERIKLLLMRQDFFNSVDANANLKVLRSRLFSIVGLTKESKFISAADQQHLTSISGKLRDIWLLFTEIPVTVAQPDSQVYISELEQIKLEKISKIEMQSIVFEKLIFQLILKINNSQK